MAEHAETSPSPGVRGSVYGSLALLACDVACGSFWFSLCACPLWFAISAIKNGIQFPGWKIALVRAATPLLTLAIVSANYCMQSRIARANAERVVSACEQFRADHGKFPDNLANLVPKYLGSPPRAKYCLVWGEFFYFNNDNGPLLFWGDLPPFGRPTYNFQYRRWGYLD